ncbi:MULTISPECIES: PhoX family phosphatase [unclassified Nodularia (in: cyanobacteria)]|uniref:PhoX family protein n=1 Tax=unclassified Nodularia (in: cyanobacteria) TaxID=2656917 RepID=UPI00188227A2|nr:MULTISPECIES: PhoX family phosphatase [unclassified Nodularia (in: cyanobacteria)]MBE9200092.1 PhoX family phosphatase [Nodularia sp. LEGE 06071]MCC2691998.1 PhoX family phosphatase [Nodularia sp. LEGE 04288]
MKGHLHPKNDITINPSGNESILDVIGRVSIKRRRFVMTAVGTSALTVLGDMSLGGFLQTVEAAPVPAGLGFGGIGFESIEPNLRNPATGNLEKDLVTVPKGYTARILSAWGDPIMPGAPDWFPDASQDAAAQEKQVGMNHDGMHFFPLPGRSYLNRTSGLPVPLEGRTYNSSGILCVNHEYTQEQFLHPDGNEGSTVMTIEKARKSQAAHGVSIQEISKDRFGNNWSVDRNSRYGRRITGNTEMRVSGLAAGDALMRSKKFSIEPTGSFEIGTNDGYTAYGTINNCAHGITPWGTYLTCEENFQGYFANPNPDIVNIPGLENKAEDIRNGQRRYGIGGSSSYRWPEVDPRFDAYNNPLEPHLFGWVVEIDPYDPKSKPVKRTSMGRFRHESAQYVVDDNNGLAFYMGDDNVNEYIYKFVCSRQYNPNIRNANTDLLDHGTLYVAKFNDNGTGEWLPLVYGQRGLTPANGFNSQAEVLIKTREAADRVGATMMDRPEWVGVRPRIGGFNEVEVYCTLTNNSRRGTNPASVNNPDGTTPGGNARPPVDAANPRPNNAYGHVIRWRETGRSVTATTFNWDIYVLNGDKKDPDPIRQGNINGDDFGSPDGLWFDYYGRLWIQTDQSGTGTGDYLNIGSNSMVCANPNDPREIKLFLTSPTDCEVTGVITTPDNKTMFVNIQHPGSRGSVANPTSNSDWPHSQGYGPSGRPRSATVVITRDDGGIIGA